MKNKRYSVIVELFCLLIIAVGYFANVHFSTAESSNSFIAALVLYGLLTPIYYLSASPKFIFKQNEVFHGLGEQTDLTLEEKNGFYDKGVFYLALSKIFIIALPIFTDKNLNIFFEWATFGIASSIILLSSSVFILSFSIRSFMNAKGYTKASLKNSMFYYNPDDKRAMIDKRVGIGSEINFGSKQGRLVFWVLIALPISFIALLVLALALAGKL